jgi:hypothetical protein
MRMMAIVIIALGIAALVDRQVNNSRVTDRVVSLAFEIKRGFLGR